MKYFFKKFYIFFTFQASNGQVDIIKIRFTNDEIEQHYRFGKKSINFTFSRLE